MSLTVNRREEYKNLRIFGSMKLYEVVSVPAHDSLARIGKSPLLRNLESLWFLG